MKRFKFRLNSVLRYRQYLEKQALMDLAKVKIAKSLAVNNVKKMEAAKTYAKKQLLQLETQGVSVSKYRIHELHMWGLERDIENEKIEIKILEKKIDEKHKYWDVQRIKKETLVKMRSNAKKNHIEKELLAEQKIADELANLRRNNRVVE